MHAYTYGDKSLSPGKDAARAWIYSHLTRKQFVNGVHIVIASRTCGDIKHLHRYGAKRIIACDTDVFARNAAAKLNAHVSPHPRLEDTVAGYLHNYGTSELASINVDLCATLTYGAPVLNRVLEQLQNKRKNHSVKVFFTFCRSRFHTGGRDCLDILNSYLADANVHVDSNKAFNYVSWTLKNKGTPMTAVVCT